MPGEFDLIKKSPLLLIIPVAIVLVVLNFMSSFISIKLGLMSQLFLIFIASIFGYSLYKSIAVTHNVRELILPAIITIVVIVVALLLPQIIPAQFSVVAG